MYIIVYLYTKKVYHNIKKRKEEKNAFRRNDEKGRQRA